MAPAKPHRIRGWLLHILLHAYILEVITLAKSLIVIHENIVMPTITMGCQDDYFEYHISLRLM